MAITYRFTLDDEAMLGDLKGVRERAQDLRPALRSIGRAGVNQTRLRFVSGRAPDGSSWVKGLKTSGQTLIFRGLLLRSIADQPPEAGAVEWGSNRIYARIHQLGGTIVAKAGKALRFMINGGWVQVKKVVIPARPYLGVNAENMAEFGEILVRHVAGPIAEGGA